MMSYHCAANGCKSRRRCNKEVNPTKNFASKQWQSLLLCKDHVGDWASCIVRLLPEYVEEAKHIHEKFKELGVGVKGKKSREKSKQREKLLENAAGLADKVHEGLPPKPLKWKAVPRYNERHQLIRAAECIEIRDALPSILVLPPSERKKLLNTRHLEPGYVSHGRKRRLLRF